MVLHLLPICALLVVLPICTLVSSSAFCSSAIGIHQGNTCAIYPTVNFTYVLHLQFI